MTLPEPSTFSVQALGLNVTLRVHDPALSSAVRDAWADTVSAESGNHDLGIQVGLDSGYEVSGPDVPAVLRSLSAAVIRRTSEFQRSTMVTLEGVALAHPVTGATAVLVAPPGSARDAVVRSLSSHLALVSDGIVAITETGAVLPLRTPLPVSDDARTTILQAPSTLGVPALPDTCQVTALLLLEHQPEQRETPTLTPLHTADALGALAQRSPLLPHLSRPLHRLAAVVHQVDAMQVVGYDDPGSLAALVTDLLTAPGMST